MANPDFGRIFSTTGAKTVIGDPDYAGGWDDIVGALPPQKDDFNSISAEQDEKLSFLNTTKPQTWTDSGLVNAYVVDIADSVAFDLFDGFRLSFVPLLTNTGSSNISGPWNGGSNSIRDAAGSVVASGDLSGLTTLVYDAGNNWFLISFRAAEVITTQLTSSDAAWVPNSRTTSINFVALGGGGGGGGADGQGAGTAAVSGGGGSSGTSSKTSNNIDTSYTIVIGAGGAGGAGAGGQIGAGGGTTSVVGLGVNISAGGGGGGTGTIGTASFLRANGGSASTGGGGDYGTRGSDGEIGVMSGGDPVNPGNGGASLFSQGRRVNLNADGNNGVMGAGGTGVFSSDQATNYSGGDGGAGLVIITELLG